MSNDIVDYKIPFVRNGVDVVRFFGMPSLSLSFFKQTRHFLGLITSLSPATLTITDARENPPDYATCGFKLAPMATEITDWDDKAQLEAYKAEVEALALELHPLARRFVWMDFLKRGGQGNNKPAVDGPHLDCEHPSKPRPPCVEIPRLTPHPPRPPAAARRLPGLACRDVVRRPLLVRCDGRA
jgi:hypothetical protein